MNSKGYRYLFLLLSLTECNTEKCTGSIDATVLYADGHRIYIDVKNKQEIGVRKTLKHNGKVYGEFKNVMIIYDPEDRFEGRKSICFNNDYINREVSCGGKVNSEDIPEIYLYQSILTQY
jgi:hypothetical protein